MASLVRVLRSRAWRSTDRVSETSSEASIQLPVISPIADEAVDAAIHMVSPGRHLGCSRSRPRLSLTRALEVARRGLCDEVALLELPRPQDCWVAAPVTRFWTG